MAKKSYESMLREYCSSLFDADGVPKYKSSEDWAFGAIDYAFTVGNIGYDTAFELKRTFVFRDLE